MLICPVCKQQVEKFHPKSHIIPEWAYKDLYDETHRVAAMDLKDVSDEPEQKGRYETYWCDECEKKSGVYDKYAGILLGGRNPNSKDNLSVTKTKMEGA